MIAVQKNLFSVIDSGFSTRKYALLKNKYQYSTKHLKSY